MALNKITYTDKVALSPQPSVAAVNKVSDSDMNEIKSVVNDAIDQVETNTSNISNIGTYSSTETIVGTFLGKPLYRKVAYFQNSTSVVDAGQFNCNVSNGERMWIESAWYEITGSNATIPFGWNLGGTNWLRMSIQNYTTGICQVNASSNFTSSTQRDVYIILNYTKSTD